MTKEIFKSLPKLTCAIHNANNLQFAMEVFNYLFIDILEDINETMFVKKYRYICKVFFKQ